MYAMTWVLPDERDDVRHAMLSGLMVSLWAKDAHPKLEDFIPWVNALRLTADEDRERREVDQVAEEQMRQLALLFPSVAKDITRELRTNAEVKQSDA